MSQAAVRQELPPANQALEEYARELSRRYDVNGPLLLIQSFQFLPETLNLEIVRNRGYYAYPPTGLQSLTKCLEGQGRQVEIFDLNFAFLRRVIEDPTFDPRQWLSLVDEALERFRPALVGVTCLTVYTELFDSSHPLTTILAHLRKLGRHLVIAGGPTVANEIVGYLQRELCHFVVEGEGEYRLPYLLETLSQAPPSHPPADGIHFRCQGVTHKTEGRQGPVRLDFNLVSTYDLVKVEDYCRVGCLNPYSRMAGRDAPFAAFQLVRGCRANCKFCGVRAFMGKGVRAQDTALLLQELDYLARQRGVRHFEVLDDDFLAQPQALIELLQGMVRLRREFGISWSANNGMVAASLTREICRLMVDSGCLGFKVGFESGNARMLKRMRKPGTVEIFRRAAALLQDFPQLLVGGNYIIGLFEEEIFGQMLDTFRLSHQLKLDWSSFTVFQYTSRPNSLSENLKTDAGAASDFIPAKDSSRRDAGSQEEEPLGLEILGLPPERVPTRSQIRNIWFTFNLVGNYIANKNLAPGGDPAKMAAWLEALLVTYPENPYMHLFQGLALALMGQGERARVHYQRAQEIVAQSPLWLERLAKFGLERPLSDPPLEAGAAAACLDELIAPFRPYLGADLVRPA